jgi:excisionase family DNA binding protein
MMRDNDFGIVRVRAFGTFDFKIVTPSVFLKEVAGSDHHFRLDEFADTMRSRVVSLFSEALAQAKIPVLDVASRYSEVGNALLPLLNAVTVPKYGIEFANFVIENVSVPPEVEQAIDKRSSMAAVGNLNDYVKFQMAQGLAQPGGAGPGGFATEMAVGMAMAQQIMQQTGTGVASPPPLPGAAPAGVTPAAAAPELMAPGDAAKLLGVSESDVLATLESGELKGKKIGTSWRITRKAIDDFLAS